MGQDELQGWGWVEAEHTFPYRVETEASPAPPVRLLVGALGAILWCRRRRRGRHPCRRLERPDRVSNSYRANKKKVLRLYPFRAVAKAGIYGRGSTADGRADRQTETSFDCNHPMLLNQNNGQKLATEQKLQLSCCASSYIAVCSCSEKVLARWRGRHVHLLDEREKVAARTELEN